MAGAVAACALVPGLSPASHKLKRRPAARLDVLRSCCSSHIIKLVNTSQAWVKSTAYAELGELERGHASMLQQVRRPGEAEACDAACCMMSPLL